MTQKQNKTEMQKLIEGCGNNCYLEQKGGFIGICQKNELCVRCLAKIQERIKCNQEEVLFLNLGKIKIEGKTEDMEFLIRQRISHLKSEIKLGEEVLK